MENKKDDFYDKLKRFAEKTEDIIDEQVEKLKKSGVIDDIEKNIDKAGDYIEKKIEEFKKNDVTDKVDDFVEKTEKKAEEVIKKAGVIGDKVSEEIEGVADEIKERFKQKPGKTNENKTNFPEKK